MLYLEDYLEMIEHLPQELRDRFTEMRELDLTVQNNMDSLEKKSRVFFQQCKRGELQNDSVDAEFQHLRREYYKVMEDADEKVAIATQIHELVERYLRRLDSELFKFKCELEADNNGITEILEKRSLELDGNSSTAATALINVININQKENRYYGAPPSLGHSTNSASGILNASVSGGITHQHNSSSSIPGVSAINVRGSGIVSGVVGDGGGGSRVGIVVPMPTTPLHRDRDNRHRKLEKRRETICSMPMLPEKRPNLNTTLPVNKLPTTPTVNTVRPITPSINAHTVLSTTAASTVVTTPTTVAYNLQHLGGGGAASSAIAAAASQAIVATQQMQQGRRTASLKASYEAIHGAGVGPTEFWISRDITNAAAAANVAVAQSALQSSAGVVGGGGGGVGVCGGVVAGGGGVSVGSIISGAGGSGGGGVAGSVGAISNTTITAQHSGHHEKKHKKNKLSTNSLTIAATVNQNLGGSSSGTSITSSSSSMSTDSVDMLSSASTAISNVSITSLGISSITSGPNSNSLPSAPATITCLPTATTTLAPGSNLTINENGLVVEQTNEGEWSYDPNEPRYCTCNQVSYGDMVACDNDACPYEWFHYPCVGITQPPKGKWYCPKCTASMRRRGNRKN